MPESLTSIDRLIFDINKSPTTPREMNTIETKKNYFIINENPYLLKYYKNKFNSKFVKKNFRYSSDKNSNFLTIKQLKSIVNKYVVSKKSH